MKNLGRFIVCDNCNYRPLHGSRLEPLFAQMIIGMVESLIPLEILNSKTFQDYYKDNIMETVLLDHDYRCSRNQIFKQLYFSLFCLFFGSNKTTRYQHILCFGSEYFYQQAFRLYSTPRALGGADAIESFNSKVKTLVYSITSRYCNDIVRLPFNTIEIIMKYCWWDHVIARENNTKLNSDSIQKHLRERHKETDTYYQNQPGFIRHYLKQHGISGTIKLPALSQLIQEVIPETDADSVDVSNIDDIIISRFDFDMNNDTFLSNIRDLCATIDLSRHRDAVIEETITAFDCIDEIWFYSRSKEQESRTNKLIASECSIKLGAYYINIRFCFQESETEKLFIRATLKWENIQTIWWANLPSEGIHIMLKCADQMHLQYKTKSSTRWQEMSAAKISALSSSIKVKIHLFNLETMNDFSFS